MVGVCIAEYMPFCATYCWYCTYDCNLQASLSPAAANLWHTVVWRVHSGIGVVSLRFDEDGMDSSNVGKGQSGPTQQYKPWPKELRTAAVPKPCQQ